MWSCCVQLDGGARSDSLRERRCLVSVTSCGDRWLCLWCGAVVWCGISSSSKKGKEKLRRHLLAEAGGQLRTPHTVNKKSLLFNFNDEKEEKEDFGGSKAKRFILK